MNNKDTPARPQSGDMIEQWNDPTNPKAGTYFATGLTKLEDFTKAAMQGLLSNISMIDGATESQIASIKDTSILVAESVLAELDKANK
jgi:hypothetical protein